MEREDIAYCSHCGNTAPQSCEGSCLSGYGTESAKVNTLMPCRTCGGALLYEATDHREMRSNFVQLAKHELLWPQPDSLHTCMPEKIRRIYAEAASIKARSPNGFANQIRRALEAVCTDRGANQSSLAGDLRQLADSGEIPSTLADVTDVLRKIGNTGSHAGDDEVQPEYVNAIDDFFRVIIE